MTNFLLPPTLKSLEIFVCLLAVVAVAVAAEVRVEGVAFLVVVVSEEELFIVARTKTKNNLLSPHPIIKKRVIFIHPYPSL